MTNSEEEPVMVQGVFLDNFKQRPKGRPRKYFTEEEKRLALCDASKRAYYKNPEKRIQQVTEYKKANRARISEVEKQRRHRIKNTEKENV